jgi:DNA-binding MarR family transcriptional regulator
MSTTKTSLALCLDLAKAYAEMVRRIDRRLGSLHGLSFADFALLRSLDRAPNGRLRRVDLAEGLGLTPAAVTRALIPLEKIGLVKREADEYDARVGYASLTKSGTRVLQEATESAELVTEEALPLKPRELSELYELVAKLV